VKSIKLVCDSPIKGLIEEYPTILRIQLSKTYSLIQMMKYKHALDNILGRAKPSNVDMKTGFKR